MSRTDCSICRGGPCARDVFPAFLKLCDKQVLVVGGGAMALEKLPALIEAGAVVTVVAPEIRDEIRSLSVTLVERGFVESDLDGVWYVVAAAPPGVNRQVGVAAEARQLFVNAVDDRSVADVYLGSVLRRSGMTLAVSSNGAAPALTALVRRGLERLLPHDLEGWRTLAEGLRSEWKRDGLPFSERRPALLRALNDLYEDEKRAAS